MAEGLLHRLGKSAEGVVETGLYVKVIPPPDTNKNTSWFQYPGIWTTYILILLFSWLAIVSVFRCEAGTAWTVVNLVHFAVITSPPLSPLSFAIYISSSGLEQQNKSGGEDENFS